jgi:hypothetical protein
VSAPIGGRAGSFRGARGPPWITDKATPVPDSAVGGAVGVVGGGGCGGCDKLSQCPIVPRHFVPPRPLVRGDRSKNGPGLFQKWNGWGSIVPKVER